MVSNILPPRKTLLPIKLIASISIQPPVDAVGSNTILTSFVINLTAWKNKILKVSINKVPRDFRKSKKNFSRCSQH